MLFFISFVMLKMGDDPNDQVLSVSWLLANPKALELAVISFNETVFLVERLHVKNSNSNSKIIVKITIF